MSNLGNESEAHGSHCGLAQGEDIGSALLEAEGCEARLAWAPASGAETACSPRGPDLRSLGGSIDRYAALFAAAPAPEEPGLEPGQASEGPGDWGCAKAGIEHRSWGQVQIPKSGSLGGPLGGELTLPEGPSLARSLALCWAGLALFSAPPWASTQYAIPN